MRYGEEVTAQPFHEKPVVAKPIRWENYNIGFRSTRKHNDCTATAPLNLDEGGLEWMNADFSSTSIVKARANPYPSELQAGG